MRAMLKAEYSLMFIQEMALDSGLRRIRRDLDAHLPFGPCRSWPCDSLFPYARDLNIMAGKHPRAGCRSVPGSIKRICLFYVSLLSDESYARDSAFSCSSSVVDSRGNDSPISLSRNKTVGCPIGCLSDSSSKAASSFWMGSFATALRAVIRALSGAIC